ncbi:MAG: AAA family ATPase [Phycisphaeraceae bacterium]|nr:MAG: AAA family ATPase [Phycisphaeraceae bacterium]
MDDRQRLEQCIRTRHTCIFISTHEEEEAVRLVCETAISLGRELHMWSVDEGVRSGVVQGAGAVPDSEHPAAALTRLADDDPAGVVVMLDLLDHLDDPRTLRALRRLLARRRVGGGAVVLIDHRGDLAPVLGAGATRFELSLPESEELEQILRSTLRRVHRETPIEVDINRGSLDTIIRNLRGLTRRQAEQIVYEMVAEDRSFNCDDVNHVMARKRQLLHQGGLLNYVEAPTSLDDIGGLRRLKAWLKQRRGAVSDEAEKFGITAPRGVLLLGVQGAGKSMCAKAIATAWGRPLLQMDPGALYDRYIGESERRLRDALQQAEAMAPIILWIDEIEKGFASAGSQSNDGGLSKRMFGYLLTWMQDHEHPVFLVATANDINALPPELLRKGRFDEIFFVDLPEADVREDIFAIHIRRRGRDPEQFDLKALAKASDGYSGAEIEQAVVAALHDAFSAKKELSTERIVEALEMSPPLSVTMRERVDSLRRWAKDRCMPAD